MLDLMPPRVGAINRPGQTTGTPQTGLPHAVRAATALPQEQWPAWVLALAAQAVPGEVGLGDVVARVIGPFGSNDFRTWYADVTSVWNPQCQCQGWQPLWNQVYPLAGRADVFTDLLIHIISDVNDK